MNNETTMDKKPEEGEPAKKRSPGRVVLDVILDVLIVLFILFAALNLYLGAEVRKNASASLFGKQVRLVLTGSMDPTIPNDSLILVDTSGDKKDYEVDDVLTFNYPAYGELPTTHRVIDKTVSGKDVTYTLKGDAPGLIATQTVDSSEVIGKVVFHSLALGEIVNFAKGVGGYICFILIPCLLLLAYSIYLIIKVVKEKKQKEKEATAGNAPPLEEKKTEVENTTTTAASTPDAKDEEIAALRRQLEELKKEKQASTSETAPKSEPSTPKESASEPLKPVGNPSEETSSKDDKQQ